MPFVRIGGCTVSMEQKKEDIQRYLTDVITAEPHEFRVEGRQFFIYPITYAKYFKQKEYFDALGINIKLLSVNHFAEAIRLAANKPNLCCRLLALNVTANNKASYSDKKSRRRDEEFFLKHLSRDALAMMLVYILTNDKTAILMKHLGIDDENERRKAISEIKAKNDKGNNQAVGGKSVFGLIFGQLKEMGYSHNEMLYEVPCSFLQLILADKMSSIYLSDDVVESLPRRYGGTLFVADDAGDFSGLEAELRKRGIDIA